MAMMNAQLPSSTMNLRKILWLRGLFTAGFKIIGADDGRRTCKYKFDFGAIDGARTRGLDLGRVALYQLSYNR